MPVKTPSPNWLQLIALVLTLITIVVGAAIWATSAHAQIKDWTIDETSATTKEIKADIRENYVRRSEFIEVKVLLDEHKQQHQRLEKMLDKMDKQLEKNSRRRNR